MKKKILLVTPLVVVVLLVVLLLVLRSALPPERLVSLMEPRLEAALGRDVVIGGASLGFFPLSARLESVRVQANPGFPSPHILELERLRFDLAFLPLLRRAIDVRSLVLERPRLVLEQNAAGDWNFAKTAPPEGTTTTTEVAETASPLALRIQALSLREGSMRLHCAPRDLELHAPLAAELSLELDRALQDVRVRGWIESRGITGGASLAELPSLDLRLEPELRANLAEQSAHIDKLLLRLQNFALELEGDAALQSGKPVVQLQTRSNSFELDDLLALLPKQRGNLDAKGTVQLDLAIDVPATGAARVDGTLSLEKGRLQAPDWPEAIHDIQARVSLAGDSLIVSALDAQFAGSPLHLEGSVQSLLDPTQTRYAFDLRTQLDLGEVAPLFLRATPASPGLDLQGQVTADIHARGALADKSLPEMQGPIRLQKVRVTTPQLSRPLSIQAALQARGTDLQIESARLEAGDSHLTASGTVHLALPPKPPGLVLRGRAELLDLDALLPAKSAVAGGGATTPTASTEILPPLPPATIDVEVEAARVRVQQTDLQDATLTWRSNPDRFQLHLRAQRLQRENMTLRSCEGDLEGSPAGATGKLAAKHAALGNIQATDLQGDLRVEGTRVRLTNVRARTYDGGLQGRVQLDLADPARPQQELDLTMDAVQLGGLLDDLFRAGGLVEGTMSGRSSWVTQGSGAEAIRKQLSGSGQGIAVNGRLRELPLLTQLSGLLGVPSLSQLQYEELGFEFSVEAGQVRLPQVHLKGNDADASVDGSIGLDGGLNLALNLKLSEALTRQSLQNPATRALGGLFTDPQGRLVLDFDIQGSMGAPKVRADLQATAARSGLRSLGEQELQRLLGNLATQPERAKEELGRSLKDAVRGLFEPKPAAKDTTAKP